MRPNIIIFYVNDPTASARFCGRLFDINPVEESPAFVVFALGKQQEVAPTVSALPGAAELTVTVDSRDAVDSTFEKWQNAGVTIALDRMRPGDGIVIYSPKAEYAKPYRLQAFTALGTVGDEPARQVDAGGGFLPFRRHVKSEPIAEVPLLPMLESLSFIKNKSAYGAVFRFGVVQIPESDFRLIGNAMHAFGS